MRKYTITVFTVNDPGVVHRVTATFTRQKVNIDSLTVSETQERGVSRFTIVVHTEPDMAEKICKLVNRTVEVLEVFYSEDEELLYKEIAFLRVSAESPEQRTTIEEIAHRHSGEVTFADEQSLVVETLGSEDTIQSLYLLLEPFGIKEFLRSGRIAIRKKPQYKAQGLLSQ